MFEAHLTSKRLKAGTDVQRQFTAEFRQLISRFAEFLNSEAGLAKNQKLRNRNLLARVNLQQHSFFVVRAPRKAMTLTPQQKTITLLLVQGLSNKEIAKKLEIETATVCTHLSRIYLKLDIHTRVALVRHYLLSS